MTALSRRELRVSEAEFRAQPKPRPSLHIVPKPEPKPFFYRALGPHWQLWLLFAAPVAAFFLALDAAVIWCWIAPGAMQ